ncbi:MAG TPA: phage tail tape measure protein [Dermatophilaceae bacterium]
MGVRVIGVRITASDADLDRRLAHARTSIASFARDVETGQRGATKAMAGTEAATAKLGATSERTAAKSRTSSRSTATGIQAVGIATAKAADEADRHARMALRLSEYYSVGSLRVAAGLGLGAAAAFMFGRQLLTAFAGGIQLSAQFEAQMRNVNSITGMTEAAYGALSQKVLDLSTTLPQEATVLAAGLYDIASSGFQGAAGLQVLEASARAASAGISTTAVAGQAISGVLNAYGLSAASAKDVSDTLFQTVNLGVLTFDQLGQGIGDVIGTAAAAGISIDGVGQAIATMTKAGIKPAEAFTALNQLMAQIITPGDALAAVFKSLGYESGAVALNSKGLSGVMADLQKVTGGNVTTMSALFTDIRSLKGALALTSDQGKLYTGVIAGWSAAHAGAGATAVALAEQMKSASAQWALVTNAVKAGTIEVGLHLLPVLTTLMKAMMDLARGAAPDLQAGVRDLTPLFSALWAIGVDVVTMLRTIGQVAAPAVGALAALAGGVVIETLTKLVQVLAWATGEVADHKEVVLALAAVYAASLLPSVGAVTIAFNRMILTPVVLGLASVRTAAEGGTVALKAMTASILTLQTVATLGLAAALFAAFRGFTALDDAAAKAKDTFEKMGTGIDVLDPAKMQAGIDTLMKVMVSANEVGKQYTGVLGMIKSAWSETAGDGSVGKIAEDGKAAAEAFTLANQRFKNATTNLAVLRGQTNLTDDALIKLAKNQGIDLTKAPKDMGDEYTKVTSYVRDLEKQTGISAKAMGGHIGTDIEAMKAFADAIQAAQDKVSKSFTAGTDVLGTFDPVAAAEKVKTAQETLDKARQAQADAAGKVGAKGATTVAQQQQLARAEQAVHDATGKSAAKLGKARQALSDLQARLAAKGKTTAADGEQLAKAADDVAKARTDLAAARAASGTAGLRAAYATSIADATRFSRDLTTATAKGLDYRVVAKLLEQGPKTAGPILQTILSDHSGAMIKMVNDSESALSALNVIVVAQARLTAIAVASSTDQAIRDLPAAMQIQQAAMLDKGKVTLEQLSRKLGISQAEVKRIADANGINIAAGLAPAQAAIDKVGRGARGKVSVDTTGASAAVTNLGRQLDILDARTVTIPVSLSFGKGLEGFPGKAADNVIVPNPLGPFAPKKPKWGGSEGGVVPGMFLGPKVDNVTIRANPREYLQSVAAHDFYGTAFMDAVNKRRLPRYADGGALGSRVASPWGGGAVQVVKVPINETRTRTHEFSQHIEHATFTDRDDGLRALDEQVRIRNLGSQ